MNQNSRLFALLYRPGPRWVEGEPIGCQPLAAHRTYMEALVRQGRIVLAGPFLDAASGGLAVLRVPDAETAAAALAEDPAVRDGVLLGEARPWLPLAGDGAAAQRVVVNLAAARGVFAAVASRGDPDGTVETRLAAYRAAYAPGAEIHEAPSLPYGGDYNGPDSVARHARAYGAAWDALQGPDEHRLDPEFLTDGGDQVAVLWRQRGRDPATGECFDMPAVSVMALRDGQIVDLRMFHFDAGATAAFLHRAQGAVAAP